MVYEWIDRLITPGNMPFVVGIAGILLCAVSIIVGGVIKIVRMVIVHRERMAKIANGMDPDLPRPADARHFG
jgi:uncharacterized membrane protein (DUF106 family)